MNLGILYPRSVAHPEIAVDFMEGLKTFLKIKGIDRQVHLIAESIGFGGAEKELYQVTEKLFMQSDIDMLVAFIDLKVLPVLEPLLYATGKLTLIVNAGANYPQNWVTQPNIIHLTLQHAFLCWLSGSLAARNNRTGGAMVTSLYDCGYLHSTAMINSFIKSGGSVNFNYINKQLYDQEFQLDELTSFLSTDKKTDTLLCVFDTLPAAYFYNRLSNFSQSNKIHLFVSPMMLENKALDGLEEGFPFSIQGYAPWLASLTNQENIFFTDNYFQQTKKQPGVFALLGWESATILQLVLQCAREDYTDGASLAGQLVDMKINTPRGELTLDRGTHYLLAPAIKCAVRNKNPELEMEEIKKIDKEWLAFIAEPFEGISSGWTNTYLCY